MWYSTSKGVIAALASWYDCAFSWEISSGITVRLRWHHATDAAWFPTWKSVFILNAKRTTLATLLTSTIIFALRRSPILLAHWTAAKRWWKRQPFLARRHCKRKHTPHWQIDTNTLCFCWTDTCLMQWVFSVQLQHILRCVVFPQNRRVEGGSLQQVQQYLLAHTWNNQEEMDNNEYTSVLRLICTSLSSRQISSLRKTERTMFLAILRASCLCDVRLELPFCQGCQSPLI